VLETLLESRAKRSRSAGGTIASVVGHSMLIAGALYATARADGHTRTIPDAYSPVFSPPSPPRPASTTTHSDKNATTDKWQPPVVDTRINIDVSVPTINMVPEPTDAGDFTRDSFSRTRAPNGGLPGAGGSSVAYDAGQVDRQVSLVPGTQPPRYPEVLRASGVEGEVVALFVVDEQGHVEEASIRFAQRGNALFEDAVRIALRRMRFTPAEAGGRKVRQLVQMPFVFTLAR
jgi:periplasmic protein TonB